MPAKSEARRIAVTIFGNVASRLNDFLFPGTLGSTGVRSMGDGMDGHFMAFKIELLRELILVIVCLGEKRHLGPAAEMISSLCDIR